MPFTFSHPAAILPFRYLPKRWFSLTGLIIGSITPDFEYFIRMRIYSIYSHNWVGFFWFDIPVAIALTFIYHLLVRDKLISNLPGFMARRMLPFRHFDWLQHFRKNFWVVLISIAVGVSTHVLWDGITHKNGMFVRRNSWFNQAFIIDGYIFTRYKVLQQVSTVVGGLIVVYAFFQLPEINGYEEPKSIFPYWFSVAVIMGIVFILRLLTGLQLYRLDNVCVTLISGCFIGVILTPILLSLKGVKA